MLGHALPLDPTVTEGTAAIAPPPMLKPNSAYHIRNSGSKSCKNIYQSLITTAVQATVATTVTVIPRDLEQTRNMKKIIRNNVIYLVIYLVQPHWQVSNQ